MVKTCAHNLQSAGPSAVSMAVVIDIFRLGQDNPSAEVAENSLSPFAGCTELVSESVR